MRAALLESVGHIVLKDLPMPAIQREDEVLIQVKTVGVCGSEVHAFEGTHPYRKPPVILGHEMSGVVVEIGQAVKGFKPGDRVIVDPQVGCGECEFCRAGDLNLCPSKRVLGTAAWPGAFGEFFTSPQEAVFHLPDSLSFEQGSLIEPLTVAVHVAARTEIKAGTSVAVLGSGSIGGMVCGVAHAYGANPLIAVDIRSHCLDAARERMGATHDFLMSEDLPAKIKKLTDGNGVDVVVIAGDDPSLVQRGLEMVRRRGIIALVAFITQAPLQFKAFDAISREVNILGSIMSNHADVRRAIELVALGQVDVTGIVTHHLPIEEAQRGMELAQTKQDGAIKVLLYY